MATLALTAALTFTPVAVMGERWIPAEYVDAIRKEASHNHNSSGYVATPPPTGVEQWRQLVAAYWPPEHVDRMLRIMACESGGDPDIPNQQGSGALGLFQIMPFWQKTWPGDYTDPWTNAAVAYQIWLTQGYQAWVCKG